MFVAFVTIFQSGCGDDGRDAFVATGANQQAVGTGNLIFNFQKAAAQTVDIVPANTTNLRIDMFSSDTQNIHTLVFSQTFPFAERIVVPNVPANVVSVLVTAFNSDGLPVAFLRGPAEVLINDDSEVDLDDLQNATFEGLDVTPTVVNLSVSPFGNKNTDQVQLSLAGNVSGTNFILPVNADAASFSFANPGLFNISASGLISTTFDFSRLGGNTTLTTTYTYLGTPQTDVITANFYVFGFVTELAPVLAPGTSFGGGLGVVFYRPTTLNEAVGSRVTYSLESPVTGITVTEDGDISAAASVATGTEFFVVATFVDNGSGGSGLTFTDKVKFTVSNVI